jgi:HJR/Mrr/RecB family endonuclease
MSKQVQVPFYDYWVMEQTRNFDWKGYEQISTCPYCKTELTDLSEGFVRPRVAEADIEKVYEERFGRLVRFQRIRIAQCVTCGWWAVLHGAKDDEYDHLSRLYVMQAVMKSTSIASKAIPVQSLAEYLARNHNRIYGIHPKKMEELVGAILAQHFNCEVRYVGGSRDRGIDLLLLMGEELVPVQVKRRSTADQVEPVAVVRDLLGVIFRDQRQGGIIVTTSDHFSKDARKDVHEVITKGLVKHFDLIDAPSFLAMIRNYCGGQTRSFLSVVPSIFGGHLQGITPPQDM